MLQPTTQFLQPKDGVLPGSYEDTAAWPSYFGLPSLWWNILPMGDPESGPMILMLRKTPGSVPGLSFDQVGDRSQLVHHHRSDVFRMAIGDESEQIHHGGAWFGTDEYFLMRANKSYAELVGSDDVRFIDLYADRRGVAGAMAEGKSHPAYDASLLVELPEIFPETPQYFTTDAQADTGAACASAAIPSGGRLRGSTRDTSGWMELDDGSKVTAMALGDPDHGPLIVLSSNPPGAVEPSAGHYSSDLFRLIVAGDCSVGDQKLQAHEFLAVDAGAEQGPVVHGPSGSTQLLIVADRRGITKPETSGAISPRTGQIDDMLRSLVASVQ